MGRSIPKIRVVQPPATCALIPKTVSGTATDIRVIAKLTLYSFERAETNGEIIERSLPTPAKTPCVTVHVCLGTNCEVNLLL